VVEISTALMFLLIFNFIIFNFSNNVLILEFLNLAFLFYIASALIIIFVYDLKHYEIPDKVLFPAIIITFFYRLFDSDNLIRLFHSSEKAVLVGIVDYILAVIIAAGFFLAIFLVSKGKWMGFGDVKLAVLMGLLLGVYNVLAALFLAFFFGAIIGVILMVFDKKNLKSEIPFGPFLIIGTFLALLWGSQIIDLYLGIFNF
jgi:prepilin signal peptidase PulO-like enzyme (type II secretory pathway)